jgi:hypothetical protein
LVGISPGHGSQKNLAILNLKVSTKVIALSGVDVTPLYIFCNWAGNNNDPSIGKLFHE